MNAMTATRRALIPRVVPKPADCTLRVFHKFSDLEELRSRWDELLTRYLPSTIFSTWEWLTCWWHAFGAGCRPLILALFDGDEALVGLALFSVATESWNGVPLRVLRLLGDGTCDSDNLDIPVAPGFEEIFANTILEYLHQQKSH